jgi:hypothetical protein
MSMISTTICIGALDRKSNVPVTFAGRRRRAVILSTQSPTRCFNSQTRNAASKSAFVLVRLPAGASSGSSLVWSLVALCLRGRLFRRAFDFRPQRAVKSLTGSCPLLFITPVLVGENVNHHFHTHNSRPPSVWVRYTGKVTLLSLFDENRKPGLTVPRNSEPRYRPRRQRIACMCLRTDQFYSLQPGNYTAIVR